MCKNLKSIIFKIKIILKLILDLLCKNFIYCDYTEKSLVDSKSKIDKLREEASLNKKHLPKNIFGLLINKEKWPFKEESLDCIFNNLYLHSNENLEQILKQYNKSLIKDGFLVSNLISNNSFQEVKFCLNLAENERDGGVSLNSMPLPSIESIGNLVGRIGYNLPSITINKSRMLFSGLDQIFEFLTQIGETNILKNKRKSKSQNCFIAAMSLYKHLFNSQREKENFEIDMVDTRIIRYDLRNKEDIVELRNKNITEKENLERIYTDHVYLTVEIASLICWRYHESQQKPKARGSAEFSLKELAIEVLEKNIDDDIRFGRIELKEGKSDEFEIIDVTDKIKQKIMEKVDKKILIGKGIIDEEGEIKIKIDDIDKKKENISNKK